MVTFRFSIYALSALLLVLAQQQYVATAFSTPCCIPRTNSPFRLIQPLNAVTPTPTTTTNTINRQTALHKMSILIPLLWTSSPLTKPQPANAKPKVSNITPEAAVASLKKSRDELDLVSKKYLPKKDYTGMREYLADTALNINRYEENANAILTSKALDAESKKEIGTIRRYGVGADVIIMYGGLKAEIDEENESPDFNTVRSAIKRTMDSLDEIILICRSNGL